MTKRLQKSLIRTAIGAMCLTTYPVFAEIALEEIIVTAEKRSQSLQDVSIAVTAFTGDMLDQQGINSPEDLNALVPGLTISKSEGFRKIVTIRGLGLESAQNDIANPSVSYHVDGVFIASDLSLNTDFIDVERIEVLRGPQGTIFGQNSTGGTINVISKKPDFDGFAGKADLTLGTFNTRKLRAALNVPLSDTVATRFSLTSFQRDGFTENILLGEELDEADNLTFRGQLLWQPTEDFSALFRAQYFDRDANGAAQRSITETGSDVRRISNDFPNRFAFESKIFSATFQWDLDDFTVKTIHSYQDEAEVSTRDNDRTAATISAVPLSGRAPEATTHEINIVSNGDDNYLDWIVGAFYLDSDITVDFAEFVDFNGDGVIDQTVNFDNPFATELSFSTNGTVHNRKSWSVYSQGTFNVAEKFRVIAGLRYTDDKLDSAVCNFFCRDTFVDLTEISSEESAVTGKLGIELDVGEDGLFYANYSRGFKPGGTNLSFAEIVEDTFEDESINAYEIGYKDRFADGRLQINSSLFYYDYENYQFQTSDPVPFSGGVDNIPESRSFGLEVEFNALLSNSLQLSGNFAYLDTEITSDFFALDAVVAQQLQDAAGFGPFDPGAPDSRRVAVQNINGNSLPKAPELTANLMLTHHASFGSGELTSRLHYIYRDDFQYRVFANSALDTVESYDLWNLNFMWVPDESNWTLELIVTNLADDDIVNSRFSDNFGVNNTSEEFIAPRQVLVRAGIKF